MYEALTPLLHGTYTVQITGFSFVTTFDDEAKLYYADQLSCYSCCWYYYCHMLT